MINSNLTTGMLPSSARVIDAHVNRGDDDRGIEGCDGQTQAQLVSHNMRTPVNQLPPEILAKVFSIVSSMDRKVLYLSIKVRLSWICILHVCHHWRVAALDATDLWANLQFVTPAFTEVMLKNAREAPLTVDFDRHRCNLTPLLIKVLSETHRLRVVKVEGAAHFSKRSPSNSLPGFDAIAKWRTSLPLLEALSLKSYSELQDAFPADFLQGGTPKLQKIELHFCGIAWARIPLSDRITHLTLNQGGDPRDLRPTAAQFLASMRSMPRLQHLELRWFLPCLPTTSFDGSAHTPSLFPVLRTLLMTDQPAYIPFFFRLIQVPDNAKVVIGVYLYELVGHPPSDP